MRLDQLAGKIGADVDGDGSAEVSGCATLDGAGPGQLSFLTNPKYADRLPQTRATAVVVGRDTDVGERLAKRGDLPPLQFLRADNAYASFQRAVVALHGFRRHPFEGVHPKAHVDPTATLGEGTVVYPFAFVGPGATLGRDCAVYPGACVYDGCVLGERVILHANAVIGADGFGYASAPSPTDSPDAGAVVHHKIPQVGNVVVEDDVEIGAGTTVARSALASTTIGRGTKLDAQVVIAHGVRLGEHCLLVSQVGVSGSTAVGHHAVFAGQAGIIGHLKIGDNVTVTAQSGVMNDLDADAIYFGSPAMPVRHARRVYALFKQLPELLDRLRKVERAVGAESKSDKASGDE